MMTSVTHVRRPHDDLTVVNSARVSFAKESAWGPTPGVMAERDKNLLAYLNRNGHWSPFAHPQMVFIREMPTDRLTEYLADQSHGFRRLIVRHRGGRTLFVERGSLWGYLNAPRFIDTALADAIIRRYPNTVEARNGIAMSSALPKSEDLSDFIQDEDGLATALADAGVHLDEPALAHLLVATYRIKAPIYVARQLVKHQRDLVWNETSRRYVDTPPEYQISTTWRKRADNLKQGSSDEVFTNDTRTLLGSLQPGGDAGVLNSWAREAVAVADGAYREMIAARVAPEQAREILPLNTLTEWYWTGSADAWNRVVGQRTDSHAQSETQAPAVEINRTLTEAMPKVWAALRVPS